MAIRLAVLGDIHGNLAALEAALKDLQRHKPDRIAITGDLLLHGPRPAEVLRRVRDLESQGALVIQGNTDVAVADFDYSAAFPWQEDVPASQRAAAEWAHDQLADDELLYLQRLPADLDPAVTVERVTRTDARVIVCGHTHVADVRELGHRMICNPGSCGYAFDGDPAACWALVTLDGDAEPTAELFRPMYDAQSVAEEISQRGLTGDVYRAATVRTGRLVR